MAKGRVTGLALCALKRLAAVTNQLGARVCGLRVSGGKGGRASSVVDVSACGERDDSPRAAHMRDAEGMQTIGASHQRRLRCTMPRAWRLSRSKARGCPLFGDCAPLREMRRRTGPWCAV